MVIPDKQWCFYSLEYMVIGIEEKFTELEKEHTMVKRLSSSIQLREILYCMDWSNQAGGEAGFEANSGCF